MAAVPTAAVARLRYTSQLRSRLPGSNVAKAAPIARSDQCTSRRPFTRWPTVNDTPLARDYAFWATARLSCFRSASLIARIRAA
jgi:hypothetical protein